MLDLSKMCRVCRDESDCLLDLFEDSSLPNALEMNLAGMLSKCSGCKVVRDDGFPQFICAECARATRGAFGLRLQTRRSMHYFQQLRGMMEELDGQDGCLKQENAVELQEEQGGLGSTTTSPAVSNAMKMMKPEEESLIVDLVPIYWEAHESPEKVASELRHGDGPKTLTGGYKQAPEFISGDSRLDEKKTRAGKRLQSNSGWSSDDSWKPSLNKKTGKKIVAAKRLKSCSGTSSDDSSNPSTSKKATQKSRTFQCPHCDASFYQHQNLEVHQRVHTGDRPYQCSECQRSFSQKGNLQAHLRIHTGERPYKCSYCPRTFRQVGHLDAHKRRHTSEKPFKCSYCSMAFHQKIHLQNHMKTTHKFY